VVKYLLKITKKCICPLKFLNFLAPRSGFPIRIRIQKVAESGSNPDPDPQPCKKGPDCRTCHPDHPWTSNRKQFCHLVQMVQSSLGAALPPPLSPRLSEKSIRCFGSGTIPAHLNITLKCNHCTSQALSGTDTGTPQWCFVLIFIRKQKKITGIRHYISTGTVTGRPLYQEASLI
jgi:hypothetical protein